MRLRLVVLALAALPAASLSAQTPTALLGLGIQAYRDLELESSASLLRRSLSAEGDGALDAEGRKQALTYLGAAEVYRDRRDSAMAAFRRLVDLDPQYRPDPLVFSPDVMTLFDEARRTTPAVAVSVPPRTTFSMGNGSLPITLYANMRHVVAVTVETVVGELVDSIHRGPVSDSLRLHWSAKGRGRKPAVGGLVLAVTSLDPRGRPARRVELPMQVIRNSAERLEMPPAPMLLPERQGWSKPLGRLTVGLGLAAVSLLVVPEVTDSKGAGVATGLVFSAGAVIGYVEARPGQPLPENVAANAVAMARWRAQRDAIARANKSRADGPGVIIEVGEPVVRR